MQEAFIRWMGVDRKEIREPDDFFAGWSHGFVVSISSNRQSSNVKPIFAPWLPDPIVEEEEGEDVTLPLMLAMERLSPLLNALPSCCMMVFGLGFETRGCCHHQTPCGPPCSNAARGPDALTWR